MGLEFLDGHQHRPGLRTFRRPHDAPAFEQIHEATGPGEAHPQPDNAIAIGGDTNRATDIVAVGDGTDAGCRRGAGELGGALRLLADTVCSNFRTACECNVASDVRVTESEKQMHLFRIAQEAVNNAIRHGRRVGLDRPFLGEITDAVVEMMGGVYPELAQRREFIRSSAALVQPRIRRVRIFCTHSETRPVRSAASCLKARKNRDCRRAKAN